MFNSYDMGIEIIQGIAGSLGVILTVPFVSIIAAILMTKRKKEIFQNSKKPLVIWRFCYNKKMRWIYDKSTIFDIDGTLTDTHGDCQKFQPEPNEK